MARDGKLKNEKCKVKIGVARGDAETRSAAGTDGEVRNMGVMKMRDRKLSDRKMGEPLMEANGR
jgi:hypothetical protein